MKKGQTNKNGTIYCKTEGYPYLGISPNGACPICGHKGMYHVHQNGASWCRICTREETMSIEKENCTTCFHFKDNICRNHGYYWKDHIAKITRCDNWKELEQ